MSVHPSLTATGQGKKHRNVLKKFERIEKLKEQKQWEDDRSAYGLPKVRSIKLRKKKAAKEEVEDKDAQAEGAAEAKPEESKSGASGAKKS